MYQGGKCRIRRIRSLFDNVFRDCEDSAYRRAPGGSFVCDVSVAENP